MKNINIVTEAKSPSRQTDLEEKYEQTRQDIQLGKSPTGFNQ